MMITNLPNALLSNCMSFVGEGSFFFVAGTCRAFRDTYNSYLQQHENPSATNMEAIVASVPCLQMAMDELNIDDDNVHDISQIIQWRKQSFYFSSAVIRCAAYNGNLNVLKWSKCIDWYRGKTWSFLCDEAARGGQLNALQWLRSEAGGKCIWNAVTCRSAVLNGHLAVLKWAHQNGCPWDEDTCRCAALKGHIEILKWARHNGCP